VRQRHTPRNVAADDSKPERRGQGDMPVAAARQLERRDSPARCGRGARPYYLWKPSVRPTPNEAHQGTPLRYFRLQQAFFECHFGPFLDDWNSSRRCNDYLVVNLRLTQPDVHPVFGPLPCCEPRCMALCLVNLHFESRQATLGDHDGYIELQMTRMDRASVTPTASSSTTTREKIIFNPGEKATKNYVWGRFR
jgi:hypothetical protein